MFHRSERLLLRPLWPEDWRDVLTGIADESVVRNLASAPWPYGEQDARAFVARPMAPRCPRFLITRARDAATVGCIGIEEVSPGEQSRSAAAAPSAEDFEVELGYWIARRHWGRGFATEAGRAVLAMARTLGHARIAASHFLDNPASGRVLAKLGFRATGRTIRRWSCARGQAVAGTEYAIDLAVPFTQTTPRAA